MYFSILNESQKPTRIEANWSETAENVSQRLYDWLFNPGSLTARLKQHCTHFKVEVLYEAQVNHANLHDNTLQSNSKDDTYWLRQVALYCDNTPWVFASTLIPDSTLKQGHAFLAELGEQPLGQALFNHEHVERGIMRAAKFTQPNPVLIQAENLSNTQCTQLWGRSSEFKIAGAPLVVTEIFLPDCIAYAT